MKAHVLLADSAQPDGLGKLGALGLGWSPTGSPTPPHAVVILLRLGWSETSEQHKLELALVTADGEAVLAPGTDGELLPMRIEARFEVSRPTGVPEGFDVDHNISINVGPGLPLEAGHQYEWRLLLDGKPDIDWVAAFYVRP